MIGPFWSLNNSSTNLWRLEQTTTPFPHGGHNPEFDGAIANWFGRWQIYPSSKSRWAHGMRLQQLRKHLTPPELENLAFQSTRRPWIWATPLDYRSIIDFLLIWKTLVSTAKQGHSFSGSGKRAGIHGESKISGLHQMPNCSINRLA